MPNTQYVWGWSDFVPSRPNPGYWVRPHLKKTKEVSKKPQTFNCFISSFQISEDAEGHGTLQRIPATPIPLPSLQSQLPPWSFTWQCLLSCEGFRNQEMEEELSNKQKLKALREVIWARGKTYGEPRRREVGHSVQNHCFCFVYLHNWFSKDQALSTVSQPSVKPISPSYRKAWAFTQTYSP